MKNFFKKIAIFLGIVTAVSATSSFVTPTAVHAGFLGMPAWNEGVDLDADKDEDGIVADIATIATNILSDLTIIASYLVIGFIVYGGYLYMFSSGEPVKATQGKKTLTNAFIGLAIAMSAFVIFGAIRIALIGDKSFGDCGNLAQECVDSGTIIVNLINQAVGIAGAIAAIFLVVGAWGYMTSSGDAPKLQKAKSTILYSLIGLVIVALAFVITAFVSNLIRGANTSEGSEGYIKSTSIVTEIANINKEE